MFADMIECERHSKECMSDVRSDIGSNMSSISDGINTIIEKIEKSEKNCTIARSGNVEVVQVLKSSGPSCSDGNYINLLNPKNASKFRFFCPHVSFKIISVQNFIFTKFETNILNQLKICY